MANTLAKKFILSSGIITFLQSLFNQRRYAAFTGAESGEDSDVKVFSLNQVVMSVWYALFDLSRAVCTGSLML